MDRSSRRLDLGEFESTCRIRENQPQLRRAFRQLVHGLAQLLERGSQHGIGDVRSQVADQRGGRIPRLPGEPRVDVAGIGGDRLVEDNGFGRRIERRDRERIPQLGNVGPAHRFVRRRRRGLDIRCGRDVDQAVGQGVDPRHELGQVRRSLPHIVRCGTDLSANRVVGLGART
ncbi:hypothetical protein GCM10009565_52000 [Amycolatopsis albidoflavus]